MGPTVDEVRASVTALVERGQYDLAWRTLDGVVVDPPPRDRLLEVHALFDLVPEEVRAEPGWLGLRARFLAALDRAADLIALAESSRHLSGPPAHVVRSRAAWGLLRHGHAERARDEALAVAAEAQGEPLGFALRVLGMALGDLGQDGWREAFARARPLLSPRLRAMTFGDEAYLLYLAGEIHAARHLWQEHLSLVAGDPLREATVHHNLGLSWLREGSPEAEGHFLIMERLTRTAGAVEYRAQALIGLGSVRRMLGEWARAEASYRAAIDVATDPLHLKKAWRGLGQTLRVSGRPSESIGPYLHAARVLPGDAASGTSWVYVELAAAYAMLGDETAARDALTRTGRLGPGDLELVAILRAEFARRAGDRETALAELAAVRLDRLTAREEAACFPSLFALMAEAGRGSPAPLPRPARLSVDVRAAGVLGVRVNGRAVPLRPASRPAELLVLLLEAGGGAPAEVLLDALYPEHPPEARRRKGQALWAVARDLRAVLGWEEAVRTPGGAYLLDPDAEWRYDVAELAARGAPVPRFMEGVYRPWARERAQELAFA